MPSTKPTFRPVRSKVSVMIILFIIASVFATWSWLNLEQTKDQISHKDYQLKTETIVPAQTMVDRVARHIVLPDQDPLVVIVDQTNALVKQHPFFEKADIGDVILLYTNKAILYDPDVDRLKNVGPLYYSELEKISETLAEPGLPNEATGPITIEVRNGSQVAGRAGATGEELDSDDLYEVVAVGNAAQYDYDTTYVVLLNEDVEPDALVSAYDADLVTDLPIGEASSDADVVLILGNNE
ncbi:MAG: LytR C-terminal domain-containing protein [Patescibacteria group bacterium]